MQEDGEIVREFLVESYENLSRLDQDMVELELRPNDAGLLASVFRTIHTIKGTCGFLGFSLLEKIAHRAESLLSQLRDGRLSLNPRLVSLILESVDAIRGILAEIESSGTEIPDGSGPLDRFDSLIARLEAAAQGLDAVNPEVPAPDSIARESLPQPEAAWPASEPDSLPQHSPGGKIEDDAARSALAAAHVRVGVGLLDKLMDLVGELVLARNQILQLTAGREDAALAAASQRLSLVAAELQEGVMKTRMQPIGAVWNTLPRVVRDLAAGLGKQIRLEMEGADTEVDRTVLEAVKDALVHLVRNACDHGIEAPDARRRAGKPAQGALCLRAYHEGGLVNIEIADDGGGIDVDRVKQKAVERGLLDPGLAGKLSDREAFQLLFIPGFSTAGAVTHLSGRGVGMDVVKANIESIGGAVEIASLAGRGTTVHLRIPLTLTIIPGLLVMSGGERFLIPQANLLEVIRLEDNGAGKRIEYVHGAPVYRRRGALLPIADLNRVLGLDSAIARPGCVAVLQAEDRQYGLVVDEIGDTQEIVVKPLGSQLKDLAVYTGATILGDGRVTLILDVHGIGKLAGVLTGARQPADNKEENTEDAAAGSGRLLLVRAGSFERIAVPLSQVARLEEFPAASIERAGGAMAVEYGDCILPLLPLAGLLGDGADAARSDRDLAVAALTGSAQVVVVGCQERSLGLVVDKILDIAEETAGVLRGSARPGLLGFGMVGGRLTGFLDLDFIFAAAEGEWPRPQVAASGASLRYAMPSCLPAETAHDSTPAPTPAPSPAAMAAH